MTEKTGKQKTAPATATRPEAPKKPNAAGANEAARQHSPSDEWTLYEVFVRARRGLSHNHVGSVHAPDAKSALQNARDLYTRRQEGTSLWVVPSVEITASSPDEKDSYFDPAADKVYRHPTFYDVPAGVRM